MFRLDSGNKSTENIGIFLGTGCSFIVKRNLRRESREGWLQELKDKCLDITSPRDGKTVYIGSVWRDISYVGSDGEKHPFTIALYHAHGESEQFHSEIKTAMDLERFPSGKFDTNELVLELAMLAYNILRMIGDESIGPGHPMKHPVKRRRIGTVIKNLTMMACHITRHGRRTKLGLGRSNIWRKTFPKVYLAFSCL